MAPYTFLSGDDLERLIAHNEVRADRLDGFVGDLSEAQLLLRLA